MSNEPTNGWQRAYIDDDVDVVIRVRRMYDDHWIYQWIVLYLATQSPETGEPYAESEATAYRLACECAAAEARARLGKKAAEDIVSALNKFLWEKTQLNLFDPQ